MRPLPPPLPGQFRSLLPPPLPLWTVYNLFSFLILFLFLSLLFFFPSEYSHGLTGPYSCPYQNGFRWKSNHFTCGEYAHFLVACHATLHPALSVRLSVRPFIRHALLFVFFLQFFLGLSAPVQMTSIMAPAHPHATGIVVYPAFYRSCVPSVCQSIANTFLVSSHALLSHALFEIRKMI